MLYISKVILPIQSRIWQSSHIWSKYCLMVAISKGPIFGKGHFKKQFFWPWPWVFKIHSRSLHILYPCMYCKGEVWAYPDQRGNILWIVIIICRIIVTLKIKYNVQFSVASTCIIVHDCVISSSTISCQSWYSVNELHKANVLPSPCILSNIIMIIISWNLFPGNSFIRRVRHSTMAIVNNKHSYQRT